MSKKKSQIKPPANITGTQKWMDYFQNSPNVEMDTSFGVEKNSKKESQIKTPTGITGTQKWMENIPFLHVPNIEVVANQVNSTSDIIGGTIESLRSTLLDIENATFARFEPNIKAEIATSLVPFKNDLDLLKNQLQGVKDSLEPLGKTLLENAAFFSNSIAVQGKLQGIDSIIATILKRIDLIEDDNNKRWNKRATFINILWTLLGVVITFLGVVVAYWLGVIK
jgi:hypothetical protein